MRVTRALSTQFKLDGVDQYEARMKSLGASIKELQSQEKLINSEYAGRLNTIEALTAKSEAYNQQLAKLKEKAETFASVLASAEKAQKAVAEEIEESEKKQKELNASENASADEKTKLNKALDEQRAKLEKINTFISQTKTGYNNTQAAANSLSTEMAELNMFIEEAKNSSDGAATSIDGFGKKVKQTADGADEAGDKLEEFGDKSNAAMTALASALAAAGVKRTISEINNALKECADASITFESALAGVEKTTKLSSESLALMGKDIKALSEHIPLAAEDIAGIAEAAGQLGIADKDILSFSKVIADLGVTTTLSANEAAVSLAKFANITDMAAADYERLGSSIVALGNNFATTETDIVSMATRLASAGELAGLTESEIMAVAAALSSVGIEAEAGGSAISKLMAKFGVMVATESESLRDFAEIAGMSAEQFADAWGNNAASALASFINGLGDIEKRGGSMFAALEKLGINEVRMSNAVRSLAASNDILSKTLETSNTAWAENNALATEAAIRYETTESKAVVLANSFNNLKIAIGDQLNPAVNTLINAGTGLTQWATDFIEANEWLVPTITAVVIGLEVFAAGLAVVTLKATVLVPVIHALNAALSANPIALVVIAISALTAGLVALALASQKSESESEKLNKSLKETAKASEEARNAYEETSAAINKSAEDTSGMVERIEELASKTSRSAAENELMLGIINNLNESVPGLNLSYDELNNTLSMTAEQILAIAAAEQERAQYEADKAELIRLDSERLTLLEQQKRAQEEYTAAIKEWRAVQDDPTQSLSNLLMLRDNLDLAEKNLINVNTRLKENKTALDKAADSIDKYSDSVDKNTQGVNGLTDAVEDYNEIIEEKSSRLVQLTKITDELSGADKRLTAAQAEQQKTGELSIDTIIDMIDSGYALALQIDRETGAVRINRDAYVALTQAKIDEQIASLMVDRSALESALNREAAASLSVANATDLAALANTNFAESELLKKSAMGETIAGYDAQIAALERLRSKIGQTVSIGYGGGSGGGSGGAAKKAETEAQKALKIYDGLQKELDHRRALDLISEEEYWKESMELADKYLASPENIDKRRKVIEGEYKYRQGLIAEERKLIEETQKQWVKNLSEAEAAFGAQLDKIAEAAKEKMAVIKDAMEEVAKAQEQMSQKAKSYGSILKEIETTDPLTGKKGKTYEVANLREQIDVLEKYFATLKELKERGASQSLLMDIEARGIDDAIAAGETLLKLSDVQWDELNTLMEERNILAAKGAEEYFKEQSDALKSQYGELFDETMAAFYKDAYENGLQIMQGLVDGVLDEEKQSELKAAMEEVSKLTAGTFKKEMKIESPSKVMAELGKYTAQGLEVGFAEEIPNFKELIARSMPSTLEIPRQPSPQEQLSTAVNAIGTMMTGLVPQGGQPVPVNLSMNINGTAFARLIIPDIRAVSNASPELKSD